MKIFTWLYNRVMSWSRHRHAPIYLMVMSFSEASFFPVPPDVMLAPMALAKPKRAWWYAGVASIASSIGGLFGYLIGAFLIYFILPYLHKIGYFSEFLHVQHLFQQWGIGILFVASFTPIPYKIFTIAGGAMHMAILPFFLTSLIGRAARFYLVAALMSWGGEPMEHMIRRYIDWIGWGSLAAIVVVYLLIKFF